MTPKLVLLRGDLGGWDPSSGTVNYKTVTCHGHLPSTSAATAAAAKPLQSCPTLCDPIDSSTTGSAIPGILQAGILEWVAISFSNAWKWKVKVKSLSRVRLLATPWTAAHQAPPPWNFPGKSTGVGCHCLLRPQPLWGSNHVLLQLLTFNAPWRGFRLEIRDEALVLWKTGRTGLQIVIYFQELILQAQFLHLLLSRKALIPFTVTSVPPD